MKNTFKLFIGIAIVGVSLTTVLIVNARRGNTDNSSIEEIQTSITTTTEVTTEPVVTEAEKPTAVVTTEPTEEEKAEQKINDDTNKGIYALTEDDFINHTEAYMKEMTTIRKKFPAGFNCDEEIKSQSEGAQTMYKECKDDMLSAGIDNDTAGKKAWEFLRLPIVDNTEPPEKPVAPIQPAKPNVKVPEGGYVGSDGIVRDKWGMPTDPELRKEAIKDRGGVDPATSTGEGGGPTGIILH